MKKNVMDVDARQQRVLVRTDFNVPLSGGRVVDDSRIRAALPTLRHLQEQGAYIVVCTHLGRPGGKVVDALRLDPVAARLAELLAASVIKADDCVGYDTIKTADALKPGEILLLENTRFYPAETANDAAFAGQLAAMADLFVNDAFAAAHRAHASTVGVAAYLPAVAGFLMQREINILTEITRKPRKPVALVLGGAKVSDKLKVIETLHPQLDRIIVGGAMANTFLKAKGLPVGRSLVDAESLPAAGRLLEMTQANLFLPLDVVVAENDQPDAAHRTVDIDDIPDQWMVVDIGPRTIEMMIRLVAEMNTVIWNGTMGIAETASFEQGTWMTARMLAELDALCVVGGGDTVAALNRFGFTDQYSHVSTGGGAFLEFLAGSALPGIEVLEDA